LLKRFSEDEPVYLRMLQSLTGPNGIGPCGTDKMVLTK